jgi:hypothetical protein
MEWAIVEARMAKMRTWVGTSLAGAPAFGIAGIALLAAIIWIANKADIL